MERECKNATRLVDAVAVPAERGLLAEFGVGLRHGEHADGLVVGARGEAAAVAAPVDRVHLGGVRRVLARLQRLFELGLQFPQFRRRSR